MTLPSFSDDLDQQRWERLKVERATDDARLLAVSVRLELRRLLRVVDELIEELER